MPLVYLVSVIVSGVLCPQVSTVSIKACPRLRNIDNGMVTYSTGPPFGVGSVASFSCSTSFGLTGGDTTSACDGDCLSPMGRWSGVLPGNCECIETVYVPACDLPGTTLQLSPAPL